MVAKYQDDPTLTWAERYKRLEAHHIAETTELVSKLEALRAKRPALTEYTDEELYAELDRREEAIIAKWAAETKCTYCGKPMDTKDACASNPWDSFHQASGEDLAKLPGP